MPSTKALVAAAMLLVVSSVSAQTPPMTLGCGQLVAMNCGYCAPDLPKKEAKQCYNSVKSCVLGWMNFPLSVAGCKPFAKRIPTNSPVDMACFGAMQGECGNCFAPNLDVVAHQACIDGCKDLYEKRWKKAGCLKKKRNLDEVDEDEDEYDDEEDFDFDDDEEVDVSDDSDSDRRILASKPMYRPLTCAKELRAACPECKSLQFGGRERDECAMDCYEADPEAFPSCADRFDCKVAIRANCDCEEEVEEFDLEGRRDCQKTCVEENPDEFAGLGCFPSKEDREAQREECKAYIEELCSPCEDEPKLLGKFKCLRDCAKAAAEDDENPCGKKALTGGVY